MRIFIDADACPILNEAVDLARLFKYEYILVSDETRIINIVDAISISVPVGENSADYAIISMIERDDILLTDDIELSDICKMKGATVLSYLADIYYFERAGIVIWNPNSKGNKRRGIQNMRTAEKKIIFRKRFAKFLEEIHIKEESNRIMEENNRLMEEERKKHEKALKYIEKLRRREERLLQNQREKTERSQEPTDIIDLFFWNEQKSLPKNKGKKVVY